MSQVYIWKKGKVHTVIGLTMMTIAILIGVICDLSGVVG